MFRGNFQVLNIRWQVQKLVFVTPADMIDQKYQSKQMIQRQKCSKTAVEVEKKVTAFGKNIHLEKFQPYVDMIIMGRMVMTLTLRVLCFSNIFVGC